MTNPKSDSTLRVRPAGIYTRICKSGPVRNRGSTLKVYVFTYACYSQKIKLLSGLHVHIRVAPVALARPYARNIFFSLQFALSLQAFTARNQPGSTTGSPASPTPRQTLKNNPPAIPEDIPPGRYMMTHARARVGRFAMPVISNQ